MWDRPQDGEEKWHPMRKAGPVSWNASKPEHHEALDVGGQVVENRRLVIRTQMRAHCQSRGHCSTWQRSPHNTPVRDYVTRPFAAKLAATPATREGGVCHEVHVAPHRRARKEHLCRTRKAAKNAQVRKRTWLSLPRLCDCEGSSNSDTSFCQADKMNMEGTVTSETWHDDDEGAPTLLSRHAAVGNTWSITSATWCAFHHSMDR